MSICIRSKGFTDNFGLETKGRLRCFAKGQILQDVDVTLDDKGIPGM